MFIERRYLFLFLFSKKVINFRTQDNLQMIYLHLPDSIHFQSRDFVFQTENNDQKPDRTQQ